MRRRVVVTGVGTISAAGMDNDGFVRAIKDGRQCFSKIVDNRLAKLKATHAGLIAGFEPNPEDPPNVRSLDRNVHLALTAFRQAVAHAGLKDTPLGTRTAAVMGTCSGGMLSIEENYERLLGGESKIDPDGLFSRRYYTTPKVLAWAAGIEGPVLTVATACAAGSGAIASGADLIRVGLVDRAVVGGSDTFAPSTLVGFDALKATCQGMCAPFSNNVGLNLGEGAAFLMLEEMSTALERGAEILAEILGYGMSNDAYHPTAPDPSLKGQVASMERALKDAGVGPSAVDYINAHGTGTKANDPIESRGIARVFESLAQEIPVSSTKSIVGHCLGAAGVLEAAGVILSARQGVVPPTAGYEKKREGCNLGDYVPDCGRKWPGKIALSNSFGFGGNNASVVLDVKPDETCPRNETCACDETCARNETCACDETCPPPQTTADFECSKSIRHGNPVITGMGLVSPFGYGTKVLEVDGNSALKKIERFSIQQESLKAGLVPNVSTRDVDRRLDLRGMDLCSTYATLASRLALSTAGLKPRPKEMESVGLVLGIATGPSKGESEHVKEVLKTNFVLDRLGAFPYVVPNSVSGNVARALFLKGYNTVLASGLGAGISASISCAAAVSLGHVEKIIAVAADELSGRTVEDGIAAGMWGGQTGVAPGEGSVALMIENPVSAANRESNILAEILGYGMCTDIHDPRKADGNAVVRATMEALERAVLEPGDIHYLSESRAHGNTKEPSAEQYLDRKNMNFSLMGSIGMAEATLPLFNLSYLISNAKQGENILVTSLSPEGFGNALVVRRA